MGLCADRRIRAMLVAAALAAASACSAPQRLGPVEPAFAPAFTELAAALDAGDDSGARRVLDGILARDPEGDTLRRAQGFERVLEGRRLSHSLDLALAAHPVREPGRGESSRRVALVLEARHGLDRPLGVRSLAAMLTLLRTGVDPRGLEQRSARSLGLDELARLELPPGAVTRVRLGEFPLEIGSAMALRATFELDLPAGELVLDGRPFPANEIAVRPCTVVRLADYLPEAPVEPSELVRYIEAPRFALAALLERAVRIAPERRAETLDLLAGSAVHLTVQQLERAVPALRWISGNRELGLDGEAWRRWLAARAWDQPAAPAAPDLPPAPPVISGETSGVGPGGEAGR